MRLRWKKLVENEDKLKNGTLRFWHTAHKALWLWLSKHPYSEKGDWPGWTENGGKVPMFSNLCFACLYDENSNRTKWGKVNKLVYIGRDDFFPCASCPLKWPEGGKCCGSYKQLFSRWDDLNLFDEESGLPIRAAVDLKSLLALKIRNLPIKEGVVCY